MPERSTKHGLTGTSKGWVKRINGKPTWIVSRKVAPTGDDADAYYAAHFNRFWSDAPRQDTPTTLTVAELCNLYVESRRSKLRRGRIEPRTLADWIGLLRRFADAVGRNKNAADLQPGDFARAAESWSHLGYHALRRHIIGVRSMFSWAVKPPLRLLHPIYGEAFDVPSQIDARRERAKRRAKQGVPLFSPDEIRAQLLGVVVVRGNGRKMTVKPTPAMRAMILLAINCGFGATDIATLPLSEPDLVNGWIAYPRPKTGADRKAKLWPETIEAIRGYIKRRPKPAKPAFANLLFLTRRGFPFLRNIAHTEDRHERRDRIGAGYSELLQRMGQKRQGRRFYSLRRTFRTIAAETGEELAIDLVMGHAGDAADMARVYTVQVLDEKLERVANHVRDRVLKSPGERPSSADGDGGAVGR